jgi:PAS domain S-box-containing protein
MRILDSHKPRSISRTLSFCLVITLVLVAGLSLGVNFILSSRKAKIELETRVEEYISALTDALKVPLWNYSEETIEAICNSYAQNEAVAKLRLVDKKGYVFFNHGKVDQGLVVERSRDIYYQDNHIGRIHIALASGYYTAVIRQLFQSFSLTILIMIGALLVMTGVLLRQFLKKPMSRFIKMVDMYAAGESDAFKQGTPYSEFRPLVDVLDKMGEKISSQMRSLELIQYAVDNSSVATYWISPNARIAYVNEAACRSLGYSKDEFVKLPLAEIDPLWSAEHWPGLLEKIKSEGSLTFESVHHRKDGSTFPVDVTATFLVFNKAEYIFAFAADITHRKQAEEEIRKLNEDLERRVEERTVELRASEEKSRLLLESVGEGVFGVDPDGKVAFINPVANRMLGYGPEELIGHDIHEKIHHSHADGSAYPKTKCPMYLTHAGGTDHHIADEVLWRKDGSSFSVEYTSMPIKKNGQVVGAVVTFMDISERKHMEDELKRNVEELERFNNLANGREIKMIQLKEEINELLGQSGQGEKYKIV